MRQEIVYIFFTFLTIGFLLQKTNVYELTLNLINNRELKNKMRKKPSKKLYLGFYAFGTGILVIHIINNMFSIPFFLESFVIFAPIVYAIFILRKLNKDSSLETIVDIVLAGFISILSTLALIFI